MNTSVLLIAVHGSHMILLCYLYVGTKWHQSNPFRPTPIEHRAKKVSIDPNYEAKNKTFCQTFKKSTITRVLMRGFQIRSQKSYRKTFNPLFGQNLSKS